MELGSSSGRHLRHREVVAGDDAAEHVAHDPRAAAVAVRLRLQIGEPAGKESCSLGNLQDIQG